MAPGAAEWAAAPPAWPSDASGVGAAIRALQNLAASHSAAKVTAAQFDALLAAEAGLDGAQAAAVRARVSLDDGAALSADALLTRLELASVGGAGALGGARSSVIAANGASAHEGPRDEGNPWRRTISRLSMMLHSGPAALPHVNVSTDGAPAGPFYDRHVVFSVSVGARRATRRYSEFSWLRAALAQRHPLRTLPALPPRASPALALGVLRTDASGAALETRRRGLASFLALVAAHPVLSSDAALSAFLDDGTADVRGMAIDAPVDEALGTIGEEMPQSPSSTAETASHSAADYVLDWAPYDDARRWAAAIAASSDRLAEAARQLAGCARLSARHAATVSASVAELLAGVEAPDVGDSTAISEASKVASDAPIAHEALAASSEFLRLLASATRAMVSSVASAKFTDFAGLLRALVASQGAAERLRLRGPSALLAPAPATSPTLLGLITPRRRSSAAARDPAAAQAAWSAALVRENNRTAGLQAELHRARKRNAAADDVLRAELLWALGVLRAALDRAAEDYRAALRSHAQRLVRVLE